MASLELPSILAGTTRPPVDTPLVRSLSFGAPLRPPRLGEERARVPVGPGLPSNGQSTPRPLDAEYVNRFPIQVTKVQRPPLREQTLQRERLLDWLDVKIHRRVVMAVAEAGYGKTTLLADFARRTRVRTLWYRLDEEDRDWFSVLNYLVAAGREADPAFAPKTAALLGEVSAGGISREAATKSFVAELATLGDAPTAIVLDDFYLVDDVPDVQALVQDLVARAPERLSFVFLTRRRPRIAVARLRALGELAELTADDLRFDEQETERLFRETYRQPLEPDVIADLHRRTEGWVASLQLVQTAVRNRSAAQIREFVRNLTGAQSELYDFLAEEVVGELDDETQQFLMKTSLLQVVDPELTQVAAGFPLPRGRELIDACEALGLLSRRGEATRYSQRYHPLVRDFLEARLRRQVGDTAVAGLHRAVARFGESRTWRLAAHHYAAAGDVADLHRVLATSTPSIMGSGEFVLAESYVRRFPPDAPNPWFEIVLSRTELQSGRVDAALERARAAVDAFDAEAAPADDPGANLALANLMSLEFSRLRYDRASELACRLLARKPDESLAAIGRAMLALVSAGHDGSLLAARETVLEAADLQARRGQDHYRGISMLNLACIDRARGDARAALSEAASAIELLEATSRGFELASAYAARAWAQAHLGDFAASQADLVRARELQHVLTDPELVAESIAIMSGYGDPRSAVRTLSTVDLVNDQLAAKCTAVAAVWAYLRAGDVASAASALVTARRVGNAGQPGDQLAISAADAVIKARSRSSDALPLMDEAVELAQKQESAYWLNVLRLERAVIAHDGALAEFIRAQAQRDPAILSLQAEVVAQNLSSLPDDCLAVIRSEASLRPQRWANALRLVVQDADGERALTAATWLEDIGAKEDIALLRSTAKRLRGKHRNPSLGRALARRLAPRVVVEDQGRVSMRIGEVDIDGSQVRRKVLALLCYLLTRQGFAATKDQVLDALWPDLEPQVAVNSLNQTAYFLRRVFDPDYDEDLSPTYLHHDGELIWLDPQLITSRSAFCQQAIADARRDPSPDRIAFLSREYRGRFALDFSYEPWAEAFRESLHSGYLEVIERAVSADTESGHFWRALDLVRRVLDLDPEAEQFELALVRLFRRTGSHAAAAEQYQHYAAYVRAELGIEPPPLASI